MLHDYHLSRKLNTLQFLEEKQKTKTKPKDRERKIEIYLVTLPFSKPCNNCCVILDNCMVTYDHFPSLLHHDTQRFLESLATVTQVVCAFKVVTSSTLYSTKKGSF